MKGLTPRTSTITVCTLVAVAALLTVNASGCSRLFKNQTIVHRGEEATVALEEMIDWSFEASHPAKLDTDVVRRALEGVRSQSDVPDRAYSPKDVEYLAPLLAQALAKARPEDMVVFRVRPSGHDGNGVTGGTLYVKGPALYLTPLLSRPTGTAATTFGRSSKLLASRSTGAWEFEPASAARTQSAPTDVGLGDGHLTSFVIDYVALARLHTETTAQKPGASSHPSAAREDSLASPPTTAVFGSTTPTTTTGAAVSIAPSTPTEVAKPGSSPTAAKTSAVKSESSTKKAPSKKASRKSGTKKSKASAKKTKAPTKSPPSDSHKAILDILQKDSADHRITQTK